MSIRGTRPDHCYGERHEHYSGAALEIDVLRMRQRNRQWLAVQCPICRGWHVRDRDEHGKAAEAHRIDDSRREVEATIQRIKAAVAA